MFEYLILFVLILISHIVLNEGMHEPIQIILHSSDHQKNQASDSR